MTDPVPIERARRTRVFARGDHVELAHHLRSELSQHGQVVHVDGTTYQYREPVFAPLDLSVPSRIVQSFAGSSVDGSKSPLKLRATDIGGTIKLCQDTVTDPEFFEAAPRGVAFSDCFVDVHTDRFVQREHSPDNRARFAYPFPFVTDPRPIELLAFFAGVFRGDPDASDKIRCLQEFVGGSMLGLATRYQRAIVNVGQGANGKSVAASVIEQAMPPGSVSAIPPQDFGGEYRRALIAGKLINIVAELPEAEILDSEAFKAIIAGDSTTGRHIRQSPFTFKPTAGHLFAANRLPGTADQTHGFWRRFIVIEFNRIFAETEQDPQLADRIVATELPHVVSWFLAGAQRLLAQGRYTLPQSSRAAVTDWKRQADQVLAFTEECTAKLPLDAPIQEGERGSELYRAYRGWATVNGHRPVASNKFALRMEMLGLKAQHTKTGNRYPVQLTGEGGEASEGRS